MTCETIRQLIRNGNEAEEDEGGAGKEFITIVQKKETGMCVIRKNACIDAGQN